MVGDLPTGEHEILAELAVGHPELVDELMGEVFGPVCSDPEMLALLLTRALGASNAKESVG